MPVQFPQYAGTGDSRAVLAAYVRVIRQFLDEIVETGTDYQRRPLFDEALIGLMRAAWHEARPRFDVVAARAAELAPRAIEEHGLAGQQLQYKLAVVEHRNGIFRSLGGVFGFRRVIEAIDTLLKSILDAAGVGGGLAEIKDYIGHATQG